MRSRERIFIIFCYYYFMAKYNFSFLERYAIWQTYGMVCIYCEEPVSFKELEIDHILPESLNADPNKLIGIIKDYEIGDEFGINSYYNWVPSHHKCNRRKSDKLYSKSSALHFLLIAHGKAEKAEINFRQLKKSNSANKVLAQLRTLIENKVITIKEIIDFAETVVNNPDHSLDNPFVVDFAVIIDEVIYAPSSPQNSPKTLPELYDWLEDELENSLTQSLNCRVELLEDERLGETLAVRIAIWDIDIESINSAIAIWWDIQGIYPYIEIYGDQYEE
jgi:hypothetical protein